METSLWLLNAAIQMRIDLDVLVSPYIEMALNKPSHGVDEKQLLACLSELFASGWIEFVGANGTHFCPTQDELRLAFHGRDRGCQRLWYGVTTAGGREWEARAVPQWDRFLSLVEDPDDLVIETTAATRARVVAASRFPQAYEPIAGSDEWSEVAPWDATYWKTLPLGVRLRQRIHPISQEQAWERVGGLKRWSEKRSELAQFLQWNALMSVSAPG